MLPELQSLAALASSLPDITVVVGEPGSPWSFNWGTRVIEANPADLAMRPPDYCRGLILHEAAHGALTRMGDIVPRELHDGALHELFNVVEDCRIENWLQQRYPGCRPWVRLYNDRLLELPADAEDRARLAADPARGFLAGLLSQWWKEEPPEELHPLSLAAIDAVKPHFDLAVAAFPPPQPPETAKTLALYQSHPVATCYRASDHWVAPTAEECVVRMTQHRMWCITWEHLMPAFRRLLDHPDSEPTRQRIAAMKAGESSASKPLPQTAAVRHERGSGRSVSVEIPEPASGSERDYAAAVARYGALIESCAAVVLRELMAESHPKATRFHRSGNLLDLRVAMQFEADPRQYDRLFQRRNFPTRPDPSFIVLVDESGSMEGERATATFAAVVVLREVCIRLGIPLAVVGFGDHARILQSWNSGETPQLRRKIARLLKPTGESTQLGPALDIASELRLQQPHRDDRLWILSDGKVDDFKVARDAISGITGGGTKVHGLGLGPDSADLAKVLPLSEVGLSPKCLPEVFARMLTQQATVRA